MPELIRLDQARRTYRRGREQVRALDGVSLRIAAGEFVAIQGASGSGKTTLLCLVGALDRPSAGTVCVDGQDLSRLTDRALTRLRARTVGFIFQEFFLQPTLTARENVLLPALFAKSAGAHERATVLLRRIGLADRSGHRPSELSGGEMQRVAIARALINQPKLLLADEPTGNLDSRTAEEIYSLLDELNQGGLTILAATHSEALAARARRRVVLRDGRIESDSAPATAKDPLAKAGGSDSCPTSDISSRL